MTIKPRIIYPGKNKIDHPLLNFGSKILCHEYDPMHHAILQARELKRNKKIVRLNHLYVVIGK